jgi:hypothetical protein
LYDYIGCGTSERGDRKLLVSVLYTAVCRSIILLDASQSPVLCRPGPLLPLLSTPRFPPLSLRISLPPSPFACCLFSVVLVHSFSAAPRIDVSFPCSHCHCLSSRLHTHASPCLPSVFTLVCTTPTRVCRQKHSHRRSHSRHQAPTLPWRSRSLEQSRQELQREVSAPFLHKTSC